MSMDQVIALAYVVTIALLAPAAWVCGKADAKAPDRQPQRHEPSMGGEDTKD
jgi:hypothetical protein